jgi:hypothetical protein
MFNGAGALVAPRAFARKMGTEADADGAMVHALRMFGIRTALIALDLLSSDPAVRRHALRVALLIHVSDTISAARSGVSGQLPRRSAVVATGISSLNVVLAWIAASELRKRRS